MTDPTYETLETMRECGGSFVRALVQCYHAADPGNRELLLEAFASVFAEYAELAALRKGQHG